MKVKDVIDYLMNFNPDREVIIPSADGFGYVPLSCADIINTNSHISEEGKELRYFCSLTAQTPIVLIRKFDNKDKILNILPQ
jgi:hypothetical protein